MLPDLPAPPADPASPRKSRPGELTSGWSTAFWVGWACVAGGFAAVWYSSRVTGFSTWWLGPETAPRLILVSLIPFVAPVSLALAGFFHRRYLPWWGIAGAAVTALVAWGDVGRLGSYATVEFVLALGGLLVSVASFAGMLRR